MGGSSSSSQSTKRTQEWNTLNAGFEDVEDTNAVVGEGNRVSIRATDHGAVNNAFSLGEKAIDEMNTSQETAFDFGESALSFVGESYAETLQQTDRNQDFADKTLQYSQGVTDVGEQATTMGLAALGVAAVAVGGGLYLANK